MSAPPSQRLSKWLASQASFGVSREALRTWAVEGGFSPSEVDVALCSVARDGHFEPKGSSASKRCEGGNWRLDGQASCRMWMTCPEIALFDELCPQEQAERIMRCAAPGLSGSLIAGASPRQSVGRRSRSKTFQSGECEAADELRGAISELLGIELARLEPLQATLYAEGGFYAPHHDYFPEGHPRSAGPSQRVATVVVYLSEPASGGQTVVEPLGLRVSPKAGSGLYFAYPDDSAREMCLHASAPCSGDKWIATQWITKG